MKKIYFAPETNIEKVELQQMIAASLNSMDSSGGVVELTETELDSGVEGESRGGFFWDDED